MREAGATVLPMNINSDFSERIVIRPGDVAWVASPRQGVDRLMLDRVGDEVARATSIVRYQAGAGFPSHVHGGGEEVFVLEGTFSDEHGDYPAGTYIRNPMGTAHSPFSKDGCLIFVKLWQFPQDDHRSVVIDTAQATWFPGTARGLEVLPLHEHAGESTALVRWAPGTVFNRHVHPGGEEILVLSGVFSDEHGDYPAGTWLRNPPWSAHAPSSKEGCTILVKVGHIRVEPDPAIS